MLAVCFEGCVPVCGHVGACTCVCVCGCGCVYVNFVKSEGNTCMSTKKARKSLVHKFSDNNVDSFESLCFSPHVHTLPSVPLPRI